MKGNWVWHLFGAKMLSAVKTSNAFTVILCKNFVDSIYYLGILVDSRKWRTTQSSENLFLSLTKFQNYTLFHFDGTDGISILILGGYNHFRNPVFISLMWGGTFLPKCVRKAQRDRSLLIISHFNLIFHELFFRYLIASKM